VSDEEIIRIYGEEAKAEALPGRMEILLPNRRNLAVLSQNKVLDFLEEMCEDPEHIEKDRHLYHKERLSTKRRFWCFHCREELRQVLRSVHGSGG